MLDICCNENCFLKIILSVRVGHSHILNLPTVSVKKVLCCRPILPVPQTLSGEACYRMQTDTHMHKSV